MPTRRTGQIGRECLDRVREVVTADNQGDRIDHMFLYLITSPVPMDFRLFLLRHSELLRPLIGREWSVNATDQR